MQNLISSLLNGKNEIAKKAGVKRVIIPLGNNQATFSDMGIVVLPVVKIEKVLEYVFNEKIEDIRITAQTCLHA